MAGRRDGRFGGKVFLVHLFYDVAFVCAFLVTFPYLAYRLATSRRFRAGLRQRLGFVPRRPGGKPVVWVHGVSAGEIKTIPPLMARVARDYPELNWVVSTTTLAGCQMARRLFPERFIFYFPLDVGFIVRRVMRRIDPDLILLMELEIWPNLLYEADRRGAPVAVINGRISEKSYRGYRKLRHLLPEMDRISLFSVQNDTYRDRLLALDVPPQRIAVTGNIKFDGIDTSVPPDREAVRKELHLSAGARVVVAGSTHHGEETVLLDAYRALVPRVPSLRLVIAPRHVERVEEVERACLQRGFTPVRRTVLAGRPPGELAAGEVLLVDTIGELERFYGAADLVFVGGSLVPVGGHNMMEPAGQGKAVLFGPQVFNFKDEAALLLACGAAIQVRDGEELRTRLAELFADPGEADRLGAAARAAVARAKGATERNFRLIRDFFLKDLFSGVR